MASARLGTEPAKLLKRQKQDRIFQAKKRLGDFTFDEQTAGVFDDMLVRSVPFYLEQQAMIQELARKHVVPGTRVYDLGCSTGTTLINLAKDAGRQAKRLIGYDNAEPMLAKAREKIAAQGLDQLIQVAPADLNRLFALEKASFVTLCWTLQFVRPLQRVRTLRRIYEGLVDHGALIVMEKVLTNATDMNRLFIELYYDFKRRNGYTEQEIAKKREALENVLVPYRIDENLQLFRDAGFQLVSTFFQWYNFVGFLCIKKP